MHPIAVAMVAVIFLANLAGLIAAMLHAIPKVMEDIGAICSKQVTIHLPPVNGAKPLEPPTVAGRIAYINKQRVARIKASIQESLDLEAARPLHEQLQIRCRFSL